MAKGIVDLRMETQQRDNHQERLEHDIDLGVSSINLPSKQKMCPKVSKIS